MHVENNQTSKNEWKILDIHENPQTNKKPKKNN